MRKWIVVGIAVVILAFLATQALPHSSYSTWCCNDQDCAPAAPNSVQWTPEGWHVDVTEEVVPFDDHRIKYNPPGEPQIHICRVGNFSSIRCIYLPQPEG